MDGRPGEGILPRAIKAHIDIIVRERTADLGISPSCCIMLCCIGKNEGCSLQELSDIMLVDKSLTTRNVKSLIDAKLVVNSNSIRNKYSLSLTKNGTEAKDRIEAIVKEIWEDIFSDFTDEEKETFNRLSKKMADKITQMTDERGGCR